MDPLASPDAAAFGALDAQGGYIDTSFNPPYSDTTVNPDIATQNAAIPATPVNDPWTSFFQNTIGTVIGVAAHNATVGQTTTVQTGQKVALMQQQQKGSNSTLLLMAAAGIVALLVLRK